MKLTIPTMILLLAVFGGLVFLVYENKLDSNALVAVVSTIVGGVLHYAGSKIGGDGG